MATGPAPAVASSNNIQTVSDFWLFVVYCLVVIVVVLFFLFYFNRVLAQILTWLINQYTWRRYNAYIEVDSIRVTLLGARILFKNLRYLSTNQSISIVKGHISIQYWLMNVRKADTDKMDQSKSKLPCRIVCSVEGLEWFIYNNVPAYEAMKNILGMSDGNTSHGRDGSSPTSSTRNSSQDPEIQTPAAAMETSLIRRLMPIQFECTTGAWMIGNNELRSMIVGQAVQASGIWSAEESRTEMDHYKSVLDLVFRKCQISLKDNMDFTYPQDQQEDRAANSASKTIRILRGIADFFLYPLRILFYPATKTRQFGHMQHMQEIMRSHRDAEQGTTRSTTFHEEYARVNNVLECSKMALLYYSDVAGTVPSSGALGSSGVGIDVGNGGLPPEWGIRLLLWNAMFHYGPWTDRQRSSIHDYFYPSSHRNNKPTPYLQPGDERVATAFEFHVELITEATLRIPTREKSKDWKYDSEVGELDLGTDGYYTRPYGWIDIKTAAGSTIKTIVPYVWGADGMSITHDIHLKDVDASTSVNYASLMHAKSLDLSVSMHSPLVWNAHRAWDVGISLKKPQIFLLRDHVFLFQDLIKDWSSTPPPDLLHFIPITYNFTANVSEPLLYLCVNEHNIISNPNALDDNAFIKIHSNKLHYTMSLPFIDYEPEVNTINFHADLEHFNLGFSLQSSHTLSAFMDDDNAQFGVSVAVEIEGSYEYYTTIDVLRHIESLNLNVKLNGVTCKLFGTVIRYLIILRDNYVGNWINFTTIDEYRQRRQDPDKWLETKRKQAESKPIQDPFEVYFLVDIQDGSLLLPENLYECSHYSQMDFQELQVELRNLDIYMDMYINVSPITWTRETYSDPSSKRSFMRTRTVRDQGNFLYIDELNIYAHRLFGPLPETATYVCHWEFDVGRITGEIKPSFLLGTTNFAQTFAYDMIDEDNAVPSEIAPAADPDVTFVKATVKQVDIYLMNENSAARVSLEQGVAIEFDNLVNEKYNQRVCAQMPTFVATTLANQDHHMRGLGTAQDEFSWVEVAKFSTGMNITVFRHTKEWKKLRAAQQNFIKIQDYTTRRCSHLYETGDESEEAEQSTGDHHVGVLYAPLYRSVYLAQNASRMDGHSPYLVRPSGQSDDYALRSFAAGASDIPSVGSYIGDWGHGGMDSLSVDHAVDRHSRPSIISNDNESFHTAYSGEHPYGMHATDIHQLIYDDEHYDHFSSRSMSASESDDEFLHAAGTNGDKKKTPELTSSIPPSIPYSGYLNRYSVKTASVPGSRSNGFFRPYLPPPKTRFIPLKRKNSAGMNEHGESDDGRRQDGTLFLFPGATHAAHTPDIDGYDDNATSDDEDSSGNEVVVTTVLEATRPLDILMTPILVKIAQEVSEAINRYDWDLESMMDSLQIEYVGQLTRYLTDQFVCTRFAVSLPNTHFHFIQNVMLPDDLPSYKDGTSYINHKYDEEGSMLCSADIFLEDFSMIGSVKFQDEAFDEKKKSVAESRMALMESRVHIDLGSLECKVQYVSERNQPARQPVVFGIPLSRQHTRSVSVRNHQGLKEEESTSELVVIDFMLSKFGFKWLGAEKPNYLNLDIGNLSTVIITEAVEILVGAVYSWLVFVDDFKMILSSFQDQRSRQIQMFIHELSNYSKHPATTGDPLFLTKPTTVLRLGSRNFRNDVGWKLLARLRYCLRTIDSGSRARLQYKLSKGSSSLPLSSKQMFENVVHTLSQWRNWEISAMQIANCRLFTEPYHQQSSEVPLDERCRTEKLVDFLVESINLATIRIDTFDFCIFEEEQETEDNSISISAVEFGLESAYKRPAISGSTTEDVPRMSGESDRRHGAITPRDGYLDVVSKISLGYIRILINPTILAFAQHMLTVQRVFTAKLKDLSHANKQPHERESSSSSLDIFSIVNKIDIVAQALINVQDIDVTARAQKLTMQSLVRGIQGSALFSNPKLTPLPLFASSDKADSDTGSGVRSSTKASKRNTSSNPSNRLILEAGGLMEYSDVRFYEMTGPQHRQLSELLIITLDGVNLNANISQPTRFLRKQSRSSEQNTGKEVLNIFSNIHKFNIHAPKSLLRLYEFLEDWRTEQGQRYQFLFQNLMSEWEEQHRTTDTALAIQSPGTKSPEKKFDIKLQFLLNEFDTRFDLLPSLSVQYTIRDFFVMVNESEVKNQLVQKYAVQLSKQELHLITKNTPTQQRQLHEEYAGGTFSIPGIRSTGSLRNETINGVSQLRLRFTVFVDFISLSLNASMIDSFLTAQSLLGNEMGELIEVLSYDKKKRKTNLAAPSSSTTAPSRKLTYSMDINLNGLRIAAVSPSAIGVFESNGYEASLSNESVCTADPERLMWKVKGRNFALSLEHNDGSGSTSEPSMATKPSSTHRRNRLAYIIADFEVQNYFAGDHNDAKDNRMEPFQINVSRIQTVMQPIALSKLAELYIYYDSELKKKKEMKKTELDQIATNTKLLVKSFKRDTGADQEMPHSLWEGKVLSVNIQRVGIAIPLEAVNPTSEHTHNSIPSALLLSIVSIQFVTKNIEKSAATLEDISLQFVRRFDQNNEDHFMAEQHPRMNQMHLPSIACHVYTRKLESKQSVKIDAKVGGFEVDIDGSLSDYVNALNIIYVKSKDRVDEFTKVNNNRTDETDTPTVTQEKSDDKHTLVHLDLEGMFEYQSGVVRMYPRRHAGEILRKKPRQQAGNDRSANSSSKMATVKIPGLTAWCTCQMPFGTHASVADIPRRLHGDIMIHESDNILHPSLMQFLQEIIAGLKIGMQQSSERKATRPSSAPLDKNINASVVLRLSRTKLDLSCQPTSKVLCSLSWDESEFLMSSFSNQGTPSSHTMSCVGSLRNVSAMVKHHFSPEACLTAKIDHLLINAMLTSQRQQDECEEDDISIVVKMPSTHVDVNMRHLQDLLILNACWLNQKHTHKTTTTATTTTENIEEASQPPVITPKPFARHITLQMETIALSVDLGQAIGKVTFVPNNVSLCTHMQPFDAKRLELRLDKIDVAAEGRLSGDAQFDRLVLQITTDIVNERVLPQSTPSVYLLMNEFRATFEYEYQHILDLIQEPIEFRAWFTDEELSVNMVVKPLLACVSIKTVPVIITMYKRFTELLEKKKVEAGVFDAFPTSPTTPTQSSKPSAQQQLHRQPSSPFISLPRLPASTVMAHFHSFEVVIYPSQFQDSDNVELCAYHLQVALQQARVPDVNDPDHRTLALRLKSAALLKNVPGLKLIVKRNQAKQRDSGSPDHGNGSSTSIKLVDNGTSNVNTGGGVSIFGIPSVALHMESIQKLQQVEHIFCTTFDGRVNVSLNLGLIRYLQELANMFTTQLDRALHPNERAHSSAMDEDRTPNISSVSAAGPSGPADSDSFDSGVSVKVPSGSRPASPDKPQTISYQSAAPVDFNPQLQVMGDATPPVEWLGFKRERLPGMVHENITLTLDQIVHTLWDVYSKQQHQ
ncbi:hypothetical protein K492DRAFT_204108 [Lichtheimia hyalospora FSU 10163]|nr:hypothetical protein K492DRAFT_204108 [Lichtheimia hyalospora FSU 10163]